MELVPGAGQGSEDARKASKAQGPAAMSMDESGSELEQPAAEKKERSRATSSKGKKEAKADPEHEREAVSMAVVPSSIATPAEHVHGDSEGQAEAQAEYEEDTEGASKGMRLCVLPTVAFLHQMSCNVQKRRRERKRAIGNRNPRPQVKLNCEL